MPHIQIETGIERLSEKEIAAAKPLASPYKMFDGGGLHLLVNPAGSKLWRWSYRFEGVPKLMAFGRYPDCSLQLARQKRRDNAALLQQNPPADPMAVRKIKKLVMRSDGATFKFAAEKYLAHWRVNKDPGYVAQMEQWMRRYVIAKIGARPIAAVTAIEVRDITRNIPSPVAAQKTYSAFRAVFSYAIANGIGACDRNPVADIDFSMLRTLPKTKHRPRVDLREFPELVRAIDNHRGRPETRLGLLLMAHVFLRASELAGGRWEEIDLKAKRWNVPGERMKEETVHIVPLTDSALDILRQLQGLAGESPFIFPASENARRNESMSPETLRKALHSLGYGTGQMCTHGFRGIFSTWAHEKGYPHDDIELQLAHLTGNSVSRAYNAATRLDARRELLETWSAFIDQARFGARVIAIA